jgi:hypothetical protein
VEPTRQWICSSSSITSGSKPLIHITTAIHATHEIVRSTQRIQRAWWKATCSTLTPNRIDASATSAGMAMRNSVIGNQGASATRAT